MINMKKSMELKLKAGIIVFTFILSMGALAFALVAVFKSSNTIIEIPLYFISVIVGLISFLICYILIYDIRIQKLEKELSE